MIECADLHSGWTVRAVDADPRTPAAALPSAIPATVPGCIHTDLLDAGLIEDPYLGTNELALDWIGRAVWEYRRQIDWAGTPQDRVDLVFDGLDTVAVLQLNGIEIGRTFNQHRTYRFDITELLRRGENELTVRFDSAWEHAEAEQARLGPLPNVYPSPFNFIRKSACNFGWDWGPQVVTAGIWRDVRLEEWSGARIGGTTASVDVDLDSGIGHILIETSLERSDSGPSATELSITLNDVRTRIPVEGSAACVELEIPQARLWWPAGMGDQPLYDLEIELQSDGELLDRTSKRIGVRRITLDTSADEAGSAFTFEVNGTPIFIRGANWIPDDCFPSRITTDRYRERIDQALEANINLLRVWGGGIYEADAFYDLCDERGLLVWQDFLFACAAYPEEQPLHDEVTAEARDNVTRLASHPSLALWNGCNENIMGWFDWNWQPVIGDRTWGLGYYLDALPAIVHELAPRTTYWAASPYSGTMRIDANDPAHGNVHIWDVWNDVDYTHYADYAPRFVSEFGFQGPPTWSTLTAAIDPDQLHLDSPAMRLHQKAEDGDAKLARGLAPHLPEPADVSDWHFLTQLNQARAVAYGIEHFRAQRPHCMGTIVWQLNDCWPVTSWAAIDGNGRRKPLWHALRRVYAERLTTLQRTGDGTTMHLVNDSITTWTADVVVTRSTFAGDEIGAFRTVVAVAPSSAHALALPDRVARARDSADEVLTAVVDGVEVTCLLEEEDRALNLQPALIDVALGSWHDGMQIATLTSSTFTRGLTVLPDRIDPAAWTDESDLTLLPGRSREIVVHAAAALRPDAFAIEGVVQAVNEVAVRVASPAAAAC